VNDYYAIIAVSITSLIPVIYGIVFSFIFTDGQKTLRQLIISESDNKIDRTNLMRMLYIFILSFVSLLLLVRIATPVPSEGWLRTLFILMLMSAESVFVYSLIKLSCSQSGCAVILILFLLFMAAVPAGLLSHNPWNYLMFISPFYWLSWAWIIPSATESFAYSGIAIILTFVYLMVAGRLLRKEKQA
jgi:hypothetical protein